jgi:hypothetical protein
VGGGVSSRRVGRCTNRYTYCKVLFVEVPVEHTVKPSVGRLPELVEVVVLFLYRYRVKTYFNTDQEQVRKQRQTWK